MQMGREALRAGFDIGQDLAECHWPLCVQVFSGCPGLIPLVSWVSAPRVADFAAAFEVGYNQYQTVLMVAVLNVDADTGFGHAPRQLSKLARCTLPQSRLQDRLQPAFTEACGRKDGGGSFAVGDQEVGNSTAVQREDTAAFQADASGAESLPEVCQCAVAMGKFDAEVPHRMFCSRSAEGFEFDGVVDGSSERTRDEAPLARAFIQRLCSGGISSGGELRQ